MIQPGLERISQLVKNVHYPWKTIHVAGTNGKGSICHYASSLLTHRRVRCGKFTSPHLVDRWDCISIDNKTVDEALFRDVERHYIQLDQKRKINASPFEILTATAFHIFNQEKIQVGVIEVGMGGKLDATNILNNQAVSVISKIARDHQGFLGNTLEEIAGHKAGILKPGVPFIVNPANEQNVRNVIDTYAREVGAGPCITGWSQEQEEELKNSQNWELFIRELRPYQQDNAVLAFLATQIALGSVGRPTSITTLSRALSSFRPNPGRSHSVNVQPVFGTPDEPKKERRSIIVDGAHNPDAAFALKEYIRPVRFAKINGERPSEPGRPVTWVLAMTDGKDARQYLDIILRPGDNVITTTFGPVDGMPWVKPMNPKELLEIALSVEPGITGVHMPLGGPMRALITARYLTLDQHPIVLTGSLYLAGDFYREWRPRRSEDWWTDESKELDRAHFREMHEEERARAFGALGSNITTRYRDSPTVAEKREEERQKLRNEIESLDREVERLEIEEARLSRPQSSEDDTDDSSLFVSSTPEKSNESTSKGKTPKKAKKAKKVKISKHFVDVGSSEGGKAERSSWNASMVIDSDSAESQDGLKIHKHYAKLGEGDRADGNPKRRRLSKDNEERKKRREEQEQKRQQKQKHASTGPSVPVNE